MQSVTAVIIARAGSQRVRDKNMRIFHGKPLVVHKVEQLKRCQHVSEIIVGSDSQEILDAASKAGAQVRHRAPEFCDEKSRTWNEVILDMALRVPGDVILWAHCTNPCIRPSTYDRALVRYQQAIDDGAGDSLISVTRVTGHAWARDNYDAMMIPVNHNPWGRAHQVAADLEPVYFQNGGIFVYSRYAMTKHSYVYGARPVFMTLERPECIDIDTESDFQDALLNYDWTQS